MSKSRSKNANWHKLNKNSLGQFLRSIERTFFTAITVIAPSLTVPHGAVNKPGVSYRKPTVPEALPV